MRTTPVALQTHKAQATTSLCYLIKIGPLRDGSAFGMTSLDRDVVYDDGDGELVYYAQTGHQHSNLASSNDLSVDNGESETLLAGSEEEIVTYPAPGVTQRMIDGRWLDGVEFVIYQINWKDPSQGHQIQASGPIGEVKQRRGGLITLELRSWSQYLQQNSVVQLDSLTCRARFGSQYGDPGLDGIYPCLYNVASEWIENLSVTVGAETVREFTAAALAQPDDYFAPGLWEWTEGANAGTSQEIESFAAGGVIALRFTTIHPIQDGDLGRIRRDCSKKWEGNNSCLTFNNRPFFRGEPKMRLSNTIALTVPFAGNQ